MDVFDHISADKTARALVRDGENDGMLINVRNPEERLRSKVRNFAAKDSSSQTVVV